MSVGHCLEFALTELHLIALLHVKDGADIYGVVMAQHVQDLAALGLVEIGQGVGDWPAEEPAPLFRAQLAGKGRELLGLVDPDLCGIEPRSVRELTQPAVHHNRTCAPK